MFPRPKQPATSAYFQGYRSSLIAEISLISNVFSSKAVRPRPNQPNDRRIHVFWQKLNRTATVVHIKVQKVTSTDSNKIAKSAFLHVIRPDAETRESLSKDQPENVPRGLQQGHPSSSRPARLENLSNLSQWPRNAKHANFVSEEERGLTRILELSKDLRIKKQR
ncbi:hypothetical protein L596_014665 [Steinernema carpocapsae]|uniref:Uncharacterized protein n=1 Tax=Steinernema carpocapsae TaxID=34508 RepID=A0A4U5NCJ9_STECR|nr:hypothetical protein L596_014665 [Steinernema carpocapsae]